MTGPRFLVLALALIGAACSNGTDVMPSLASSPDRLAPDKSPETMLRVADATRAGGDLGTAVGLYRRAHELAPQDPVPLARLGATFVELHAYNEAADAFRLAVERAPDDIEVRRGYGTVLLTLDKPQLALAQLDAALALHKDPRLYNMIGVAHDLVGRHDLAQQNYVAGLLLAPDSPALRNNLGLSQALADDFPAAIATLSAAAASSHATARTRQNLALAYGLSGDGDKAAAVARTDLDEASVKSNLAYYAMLRGMDDHARAAAIIGARAPAHPTDGRVPDGQAADAKATGEAPQTASLAAPPQGSPHQAVETAFLAPPAAPVAALPAAAAVAPPAKRTPRLPAKAHGPAPATPGPLPPTAPLAVAKAEDPIPTEPAPAPVAPAAATAGTPLTAEPAAEAAAPATTAAENAVPPGPAPEPAASATITAEKPAPADPAPGPDAPVRIAAEKPAPAEAEPGPAREAVVEAAVPATEPAPQPEVQPSAASAEAPPTATPTLASIEDEVPSPTRLASAAQPAGGAKRHGFFVQVGAFHDAARAHRLCDGLAAKGYDLAVSLEHVASARDWFFCRSTGVTGHAEAVSMAQRLHDAEDAPALLIPVAAQSQD